MSTPLLLAGRQVRNAPGRVAAVIIAALLSAMAIMATGTFITTMQAGMRVTISAPISNADVFVSNGYDIDNPAPTAAELAQLPEVVAAAPNVQIGAQLLAGSARHDVQLLGVPESESLRWTTLASGADPSGPNEVALSQAMLDRLKLQLGDEVLVETYTYGETIPMAIVGVIQAPQGAEGATNIMYVDANAFAEQSRGSIVDLAAGVSPETFVNTLNAGFGDEEDASKAAVASTYVDELVDQFSGGSNLLATVFLAFVLIALVAATMVIRNTFQVLLAQRLRQHGLLRLVGATGGQVQSTVLIEALIVALVGAIAGITIGFLLGWGIAALAGLGGGGARFPIIWAIAALVVTVAMTLIAAWAPAAGTRRLSPVAALAAASTTEQQQRRTSVASWIIGGVLTGLGAAGLLLSALGSNLLSAIGSGVIAAIGLIILVPLIVRAIMPAIAKLLGGGVVSKIAGENLVRTSRRSGTVVLAIALGGSLVLAMLTAIGSVGATLNTNLDERYRVDAAVMNKDGSALTEAQIVAIGSLEAVERSAPVRTVAVDTEYLSEIPGAPSITSVAELPAEWVDQIDARMETMLMLVPEPQFGKDGYVPANTNVAAKTADGGEQQFVLVADPVANELRPTAQIDGNVQGVVNPSAFAQLGSEPAVTQVWIDAKPGESSNLVKQLSDLTTNDPALSIGGPVHERSVYEDIVGFLTAFVLAMLALTVVISAIGLASIVALAVAERHRELALLRALGTTRGGVRTMVLIEAITLALIGAALSILIGVPLGVAAVYSALGNLSNPVLALPWLGIVSVVLVAIVIGILAGLGPAHRAARVAPAQALAHE
ncbi:FtsX-like permease family protein [Gulosibacter macacae]|uniref:FtsX-like permease family protein n=1 Tax=Gulosibacter macacae TaxID=2488791 RepID=A0A3P3VZF9_9MICO|nr:FtsX-like permease family protein [Gulosibacter macacae]RRJ87884.1 FtsX-like permease family protein [Gulosibacter macacae]